jgi:hypothetical protein
VFSEVPQWVGHLAAGLVLYVAVMPVAATAVMSVLGLNRRTSEPLRLFASIAVPTIGAMLFSVALVSAGVDVDGVENLNERYVFYVAPLTFVGLALWVRHGLPRPRLLAFAALAACSVLVALLPIVELKYNAGFQSVALLPWLTLPFGGWWVRLFALLFVLGSGMLWIGCRADRVGRLWAFTALWMTFVGVLAVGSNAVTARGFEDAYSGGSASWVDDALPPQTTASVLWDQRVAVNGRPDPYYAWLMVAEFFNAGIEDVLRLGRKTHYENVLPTQPVELARDGTVIDGSGNALSPRFVVVSCRVPAVGRLVAGSPRGALRLLEIDGVLRLRGAPSCTRSTP